MMLSCGDALVDFLPVKAVDGRDAVVPAVGGSCLNVAVGMARLGSRRDSSAAFRPTFSGA